MPSSGAQLVFLALGAAFLVWVWATIFRKAGYSWPMGFLMLVPFVNFFVLLYFVFAEWPIQAELARCSPQGDRDKPTDRIDTMLRQAAALEQRGEWQESAKLFDLLAEELKGLPGAHFAATSAKRVRDRHLSATSSTA